SAAASTAAGSVTSTWAWRWGAGTSVGRGAVGDCGGAVTSSSNGRASVTSSSSSPFPVASRSAVTASTDTPNGPPAPYTVILRGRVRPVTGPGRGGHSGRPGTAGDGATAWTGCQGTVGWESIASTMPTASRSIASAPAVAGSAGPRTTVARHVAVRAIPRLVSSARYSASGPGSHPGCGYHSGSTAHPGGTSAKTAIEDSSTTRCAVVRVRGCHSPRVAASNSARSSAGRA